MPPIFERWPTLRGRVPYVSLATLPTPVTRPQAVAAELGLAELVVKRDDLSGEPYGGNKVRKLEFLLADALASGASETLTFGAAGSNHALATAVYARRLGLRPISLLSDQPNASYVRRNLLAGLAVGCELRFVADLETRKREAVRVLQEREEATGRRPYVVPMGGTSPLGALGFVNAALELGGQASEGALAAPDVLYVPLGSMGTAAGLIVGLEALGWPTRVVAVRVVPQELANEAALGALVADTTALLRDAGASEVRDVPRERWSVHDGAFGEEYARFTAEGMDAVRRAAGCGVPLEGTYTGKTFAALIADAASGTLAGRRVLFWDTYNSRDLAPLIGDADWRDLPEPARRYFTDPLQELDR